MKINEQEIEFNVFNVTQAKKLEDALIKMDKNEVKALAEMKDGKIAKGVSNLYKTYKDFFIDCISVDIVGDCDDALIAQGFVVEFKNQFIDSAKQVIDDRKL